MLKLFSVGSFGTLGVEPRIISRRSVADEIGMGQVRGSHIGPEFGGPPDLADSEAIDRRRASRDLGSDTPGRGHGGETCHRGRARVNCDRSTGSQV